jgi:hypothetical protein
MRRSRLSRKPKSIVKEGRLVSLLWEDSHGNKWSDAHILTDDGLIKILKKGGKIRKIE